MDNDNSNGADSISWLDIDENDSGILVISKYCLTCQETSNGYDTWETSVVQEWLNNTFYNDVFAVDEKAKIKKSTTTDANNPDAGIDGGNDTTDNLFLLSIDEVYKYFTTKEERITCDTLHVQELVDEDDGAFNWLLRAPGKRSVVWSGKSIYQSYFGSNGLALLLRSIMAKFALQCGFQNRKGRLNTLYSVWETN